MTTEQRSGAEIIWEVLVREGVDVVFGYPGGAIMPTYDALPRYPVRHVLSRHEQGAAHMADGYARATGKVGVAMATSGPGATNLVTGIATAMLDSSPLVCITGQVSSAVLGRDAFQETDITGITLPITKHNELVTRVQDIQPALRRAFHIARSGRPGPVLVDITKDAQQTSVPFVWDEDPILVPHRQVPARDGDERIERAAEMIAQAQRPLILAGQGIVHAGAARQLQEFVERTDIPVACTLLGLGGFPGSHPRNLGMMGMHGEAWVNEAIQSADLLIALGMRFDDRVTGKLETYAPNAKKIHVELDPAEIGKNVPVDLPIIGDVRDVLLDLNATVRPRLCRTWIETISASRSGSAPRDIKNHSEADRLLAAHVIHDLWRLTEGQAIVVSDVGQHQMWEAQYYQHEKPRSLITSGGLGTMGFAVPAAIGAQIARPRERVWVVVGDGGFQMSSHELSTCAQEGIDIKIAIINNGYLGMVRQWQEFFFESRYVATAIGAPDFVKLAEAHGLAGLRATNRAQAQAVIAQANELQGTVVVDFRVEAEESVFPMVPSGADLDVMIRRPAPQES